MTPVFWKQCCFSVNFCSLFGVCNIITNMKLRILVVQNSAILENKSQTFKNVDRLLSEYKNEKPNLIVFPEVWSSGWCCRNFQNDAEEVSDSETIDYLKNIAKEFNSPVIGGSFIQKVSGGFKNSCPIISKKGVLVDMYDKIHLFSHKGSEENKYITPGNDLLLLDLGYTKIGVTICYDIRFPEIYRQYSKLGAEIFVNVAAWSSKKPEHWNIMHRARAIENQCFMIVADQSGKISENEYNLGHSMVIDGWGDVIDELGSEEGCIITDIDLDKIRNLRKNFPLISDRKDDNVYYFKCREIKLYE